MQQTAIDQVADPTAAGPLLVPVLDAKAVAGATVAGAVPACADPQGYPPELVFTPVWIPVPLSSDPARSALPAHPTCPVRERPTDAALLDPTAYFCIAARLAVRPPTDGRAAPMVLVVPGLLHSGKHEYVVETGRLLFARGYSVALVDVRDHGDTLHGQPWLPSTFGILEGWDVLAVARAIAAAVPPRGEGIRRFGVLGYSAGGRFALQALADDSERLLSEGVLAISPLLDIPETVERMGSVGPCLLWSFDCINRRAMAYYFMDLIRLRLDPAGADGEAEITPLRYVEERIRPFPAYAELPRAERTLTAEALGAALRTRMAADVEDPTRLTAAILTSADDPVVGAAGARTLDRMFGDTGPVGVFMPRRGGHIALSVVSSVATRAFIATFFDRGRCTSRP